mmetsp:Transcript_11239/g.45709  ORF Transcript_11239/g.45709 Transcript_11239/m.45709 type:complete len:517 (+) Transcript_11239:76-1626(+)|eukprot:CAMPEP_0114629892 /NCGR_PEP_ID=MMETSP0168-20121206/13599_1 /TAXON_ID=95228 ORGANISM="Vannella sp., Strain DIVA3 517/6/12" /NCGR_SAMPLE_ID=MMETSP0168 /ASSEMBLY_ACC=CAM_ASM_000044 /LENGTH=516 /DNA_ID=CAMNT_0001841377 /DNA_START=57 /DNA_END=1607 /DNA_ORIENTATION=+
MEDDGLDLTAVAPETQRDKTIKELYTSEQTYVSNLKLMMDGYITPLKYPKKHGIINAKVASGIFSNIESIYTFHQVFMNDIENRVKNWGSQQLVGDIFLSLAPYLKLYTQYCSNYDYSMNLVQMQKKTNGAFSAFLQEMQNHKGYNRMYITSFLILPIQRIPRYEMFLKELVKLTANTHPDYEALSDALDRVSSVATFVNEACIRAENMLKIIDIGKKTGMDNLLTPGRDLVGEHTVEVDGGQVEGEVVMYIFNDALMLAPSKLKKSKYTPTIHTLHTCWVRPYDELDSFQLVTTMGTYIVRNVSEEAQLELENAILDCVKKGSKKAEHRDTATFEVDDKGLITVKSTVQEQDMGSGRKKSKKSRLGDWKKEMKRMKKSHKKKDEPAPVEEEHDELEDQRSPRSKACSFQHVTMSSRSQSETVHGRRTSLPHDATEADRSSYRAAAAMAQNKGKKSKFSIDHHSARELKRSLSFKVKKSTESDFIKAFREETKPEPQSRAKSAKKKSRSSIVFRGE